MTPGVAVTDTIKRVDGAGCVLETPDRAALRADPLQRTVSVVDPAGHVNPP